MNSFLNLLATVLGSLSLVGGWRIAEPGWDYQFPRDHHAHSEFKTEWWYFTGNLTTESGQRFGYELTFFRQGIRPPAERTGTTSRLIVDDLKFAHFTITDAAAKRFLFYDKASRGSFGDAGFDADDRLAWIDRWSVKMKSDGSFDLRADAAEGEIALHLVPTKRPVIHGVEGISRKATGSGHASHYYSITRLTTTGNVQVAGKRFGVGGESWFDHEWATNQLASNQAGWNWVSAQFDDGSELMLYGMRLTNGGIDPASSGTFVQADGSALPLTKADFEMIPDSFWHSNATKADYPVGWRIAVPKLQLSFQLQPVLANQELAFTPVTYWEGAFDLSGMRGQQKIRGRGYLELTGYAGPLQELNR
jgi:predicted secreted hydrolase